MGRELVGRDVQRFAKVSEHLLSKMLNSYRIPGTVFVRVPIYPL